MEVPTPDFAQEHKEESTTNPEIRRVARLSAYFGGIALAVPGFDTRADPLTSEEQQALHDAHLAMKQRFAPRDMYTLEDAKAQAAATPQYLVYFAGELVSNPAKESA